MYNIQCTYIQSLCNVYLYSLYIVHCTLYIVHCTLYICTYVLINIYCVLYIHIYNVQCKMYNVQCTKNMNIQCTINVHMYIDTFPIPVKTGNFLQIQQPWSFFAKLVTLLISYKVGNPRHYLQSQQPWSLFAKLLTGHKIYQT